MCDGWTMGESRRTFSMRNCHLARDKFAAHNYAIRMSASKTSSPSTSALPPGKMQLRTAFSGSNHSAAGCSHLKPPWINTLKQRGQRGSNNNKAQPHHEHHRDQPTHVTSVVKSASDALVLTTTEDAAQKPNSQAQEIHGLSRLQCR